MLMTILAVAALLAGPGELDPTFDNDGTKTFGAVSADAARTVLVQPDGKLVLAGYGDTDFAVARLNPDGISDLSFDGGISGADFGGFDFGHGAALQPDGRIVVAGKTEVNFDIAVARFNADGSLDASFDQGGSDGPGKKVFGSFGSDAANAVLVQPDGRIVVGGTIDGNFAVARLNADGSFDTSFDGDGLAGADFGGSDDGFAAALQPDGRIVVAGQAGGDDVAVARFNADGSLDASFDVDGTIRFGYGGVDVARAVLVQPDGRIVVVGHGGPFGKLAVTRLRPDGLFDPGFGDAGTAWVAFGSNDFGNAAVLQPDGKIVVGGERSGDDDDFAIARLQPGGVLDTTFGSGGRTTLDFGGQDVGSSLALQPDGRIVIAGDTTVGNDIAVARLLGDPPLPGGTGAPGGQLPRVLRCAGRRATIVGTGHRDVLRGTRRADVIVARGGNDRIRAGRGNDRVCGGAGNDRLFGGPGKDRCLGGSGRDRAVCETRRGL